MPNPKKRFPAGRSRLRRTHYKLDKKLDTMECPQCGQPKQMHNMCPSCGFYNKREVRTLLQ